MANPDRQSGKKEGIGKDHYLNCNCWLVSNLRYPPYKRCQYCELRFRKCLFLQYQIITLITVCFSFLLISFFDHEMTPSVIFVIFIMITIYAYFFNNSTEKIIRSHFLEKQAKNELKELSDKLEEKVQEQTKDIRMQNEHLEELLNMKSEFLRTVNHQLNTPLSIMKSAFSMMEDKSLSREQGIEIASHGLQRMSSTIEDFWIAYEMEEKQTPIRLSETDIKRIVKDMVKEKRKMEVTIKKGLKIRIPTVDFPIPNVFCDGKKMSHAISNLLDNAVYYTQKGTITVRFQKIRSGRKEYLKILIEDTGEGIAEKDQKKLFQRFSRGSTTSSVNPNGSGLGLYIAKKIIENSRGELKLERSEIGKGTTFSISLETVPSDDKARDAQA